MGNVGLSSPGLQYGALPWRTHNGELQILLLTTLSTRRWIVPKGWPIPGCSAADCARLEALEEAGVSGEITHVPVGSFDYRKRRKNGEEVACCVEVFPLRVSGQRRTWPEKGQREARWCALEEAMALVTDEGLRRVIAHFAQSALAYEQTGRR